MLTIKQFNKMGAVANANPEFDIAKGEHGRHYYGMSEVEPICSIADSIGSSNIDYSGVQGFYNARENSDEPGNAINLLSWAFVPTPELTRGMSSNLTPSLGQDLVMVTCAKAINAPISPELFSIPKAIDSCPATSGNGRNIQNNSNKYFGGCVSWYMGDAGDPLYSQIKIHPYYAVFLHDVASVGANVNDAQLQTPFYDPMKKRDHGETYIVCAVKRGDSLEHYVGNLSTGEVVFTGSADITTKPAAMVTAWNNADYGDLFRCGHSAVGTPSGFGTGSFDPLPGNSKAVAEWEQSFYFKSISHFSVSAPPQDVIILGLKYMLQYGPKGFKKLPPAWTLYT